MRDEKRNARQRRRYREDPEYRSRVLAKGVRDRLRRGRRRIEMMQRLADIYNREVQDADDQ